MSEKPPKDPDEGVRRFLTDLRSASERRSWEERRRSERRATDHGVEEERRDTAKRRGAVDRRIMLLDRRRGISEPYTRQHAKRIRDMLLNPDADVACPRCNGNLLLGPPCSHGSGTAREVRCTACRRTVVITNFPAKPLSEPTR